MNLKMFDLLVNKAPTYQAFSPLQFASNAPKTVHCLTWCSLATSPVVVRGSASMILSTGHRHLPIAGHSASHHSRLSSPLQNFLNPHCTVHSLAVSRLNALLMLRVVSATL